MVCGHTDVQQRRNEKRQEDSDHDGSLRIKVFVLFRTHCCKLDVKVCNKR